MSNLIATRNPLTASRMMVIAKRTNSELMAGAKAMMIEDLKRQMGKGVAHFIYRKKDGSIREAFGTLNTELIARHINGRGISREFFATSAYFDVEAGG